VTKHSNDGLVVRHIVLSMIVAPAWIERAKCTDRTHGPEQMARQHHANQGTINLNVLLIFPARRSINPNNSPYFAIHEPLGYGFSLISLHFLIVG
jgi:hypothetical protein